MRTYNYNYKTNRINFKKFINIEIQNKRKIIKNLTLDQFLDKGCQVNKSKRKHIKKFLMVL